MTKQPKRVAIYARLSSDDQTTDNQLLELRQVAEQAGWQAVETYVDHAIRGSKFGISESAPGLRPAA
jgi:DNA invertase Pin-like site-specific DNA recombinase